MDSEKIIESVLSVFDQIDAISSKSIPDMQLYMDQVTTFMDDNLKHTTRHPEDKVLTKTMINNYAKNKLLPSPEKKKYSKEHMLLLIFIYYFKSFLSIGDIQNLLAPLTERYFQKEGSMSMVDLYDEVLELEKTETESIKESIRRLYKKAENTFTEAEEQDREFLQLFSYVALLSYDIYVKKLVVSQLIDRMAAMHEAEAEPDPKELKKEEKRKKKAKDQASEQ